MIGPHGVPRVILPGEGAIHCFAPAEELGTMNGLLYPIRSPVGIMAGWQPRSLLGLSVSFSSLRTIMEAFTEIRKAAREKVVS